ncbi:MAG: DUF3108 domain-containing protein [bacterium]
MRIVVGWIAILCLSTAVSARAPVPFSVGERLIFSVEYGPISAGTASMEVRRVVDVSGKPCYHIVSLETTNDFFSRFFRIRDRYDSYIDTLTLATVRFDKEIEEGRYKAKGHVVIDQDSLRAVYSDGDTVEVIPGAKDAIATLYYVRGLDISVGDTFQVSNHTDKENYMLEMTVPKALKVRTPLGTFDCIEVQPRLEGTKVFEGRKGLTVWFTDDEWKIPVLIRSRIMVGSIQAIIKEIEFGS